MCYDTLGCDRAVESDGSIYSSARLYRLEYKPNIY